MQAEILLHELQNLDPAYVCKECGLGVVVLADKEPIRACRCEATVITNMSGLAEGAALSVSV